MLILLENGKQIRGDLIQKAIIRSDLAPVPMSLEVTVKAGEENFDKWLQEGKTLTATGNVFQIIKSSYAEDRNSGAGERKNAVFEVIALLQACADIAYVRKTAVIKENTSILQIYRSLGAKLKAVENDVPIERFSNFAGDTSSFLINRVLQEQGGVVRWKNSKMEFIRIRDLFKQKPALTLPENASDRVETEFLERHEVPWYFSLSPDGNFIHGDRAKARTVEYTPFKNQQQLINMSRCLVRRKVMNIKLNQKIGAGDLIQFSNGEKLAVMTAAHSFKNGADGENSAETITRLWLGEQL